MSGITVARNMRSRMCSMTSIARVNISSLKATPLIDISPQWAAPMVVCSSPHVPTRNQNSIELWWHRYTHTHTHTHTDTHIHSLDRLASWTCCDSIALRLVMPGVLTMAMRMKTKSTITIHLAVSNPLPSSPPLSPSPSPSLSPPHRYRHHHHHLHPRPRRYRHHHHYHHHHGLDNVFRDFRTLLKYSPIHNVGTSDEEYPCMLLTTADHDDRVVPLHSFKLAATLQHTVAPRSNQNNPLLIRIECKV